MRVKVFEEDAQDSEFCLFFGRIEDTINCFGDLLTCNMSLFFDNHSLKNSNAAL
jgi:hypothetical protein